MNTHFSKQHDIPVYRGRDGVYRQKIKSSSVAEHMVLPATGAGISGLVTLLRLAKTKGDIRDKIKRLVRNASLGAMVGGGLEAGRVGLSGVLNSLNGDNMIDGDPVVDGHFVRYK